MDNLILKQIMDVFGTLRTEIETIYYQVSEFCPRESDGTAVMWIIHSPLDTLDLYVMHPDHVAEFMRQVERAGKNAIKYDMDTAQMRMRIFPPKLYLPELKPEEYSPIFKRGRGGF